MHWLALSHYFLRVLCVCTLTKSCIDAGVPSCPGFESMGLRKYDHVPVPLVSAYNIATPHNVNFLCLTVDLIIDPGTSSHLEH